MKIFKKISLLCLSSLGVLVNLFALSPIVFAEGCINIDIKGGNFNVSNWEPYKSQGFDGLVLFFSQLSEDSFLLDKDAVLLFKFGEGDSSSLYKIDDNQTTEIDNINDYDAVPATCTHYVNFAFELLTEDVSFASIERELYLPIYPADQDAIDAGNAAREEQAEVENIRVALCIDHRQFEQIPNDVVYNYIRRYGDRGEGFLINELYHYMCENAFRPVIAAARFVYAIYRH
ncbi:MAG: hypothetical protein LBJ95_02905 [Oscillospiraceae bacterium]|jgi:hypothetical protein|nr:hypothetical protein [Oscillospiraceae bacterium]